MDIQSLSQGFQRFTSQMIENDVSAFFTILIIGFLGISLIGLRSDKSTLNRFSDIAPNVLTTLGILGTFLGIFLGLLDFDVQVIERSVPKFLEGLKIAFGTSIVGLATALIFRLIKPIISKTSSPDDAEENQALNALNEMVGFMEENVKTSKEGFDQINRSISGDSDGSLVGQVQRLRAAVGDLETSTKNGFERQIDEFNKFADHMSKAFSEAIVEELKSVIREFNEKISEQFGDNFKQLNAAVGNLLVWQENYKNQMEELRVSIDKAVTGIQSTENSISNIAEASSQIPENVKLLSDGADILNQNLLQLHEGLSSVSKMRANAEAALPEIAEKIDKLTSEISSSVETLVSEQKIQMTEVSNSLRDSLRAQQDTQEQMLNETQRAFNETVSSSTQKLNEAIVQLDEAMQKEIEAVIRTMAENLSGITQKFVQDYNPLLEQTRKLIELSSQKTK